MKKRKRGIKGKKKMSSIDYKAVERSKLSNQDMISVRPLPLEKRNKKKQS